MSDDKYVIIQWPEVQDLMEKPDLDKNSALINDGYLYDLYGDSAYFVNEDWLKKVNKDSTLELYHL